MLVAFKLFFLSQNRKKLSHFSKKFYHKKILICDITKFYAKP